MNKNIWQGRFDGEDLLHHRIFQRVKLDNEISANDFVLTGFAVDEGVKRNKGREGAKDAPDIIRKNMCNFPVISPNFVLKDLGNVHCHENDLENAQNTLADLVKNTLLKNAKSVVLGGGHEVTFAHYSGLRKAFPNQKIGIVNFDAHFDNREINPSIGATSGTGFWQIAQQGEIHSLHIGIQRNSNTLKLFDFAHEKGMKYILNDELFFENLPNLLLKINAFLEEIEVLYITICMDVFNVAIAPGVSAPAYNGIFADTTLMMVYRHLLKSEKIKALDVAEVNPKYDIQDQTARLAAALVNEWFMI